MIKRFINWLMVLEGITIPNSKRSVPMDDFNHSPLRFELEVLLEEYRNLTAEIRQRNTSEQQTISFTIAFIAAGATISQFLPNLISAFKPIYLFFSLLFSLFALIYINDDAMMTTIGLYIQTRISPRVDTILSKVSHDNLKSFGWESFRSEFQLHKIGNFPFFVLLGMSRNAVTIIPGIISIMLYWLNAKPFIYYVPVWEKGLFIFTVVVQISVFATAIFIGIAFFNASKKKQLTI